MTFYKIELDLKLTLKVVVGNVNLLASCVRKPFTPFSFISSVLRLGRGWGSIPYNTGDTCYVRCCAFIYLSFLASIACCIILLVLFT